MYKNIISEYEVIETMCNAITISGTQCKNKSTTRYCHRHFELYENEPSNDTRVAELEAELKKARARNLEEQGFTESMCLVLSRKNQELRESKDLHDMLETKITSLHAQYVEIVDSFKHTADEAAYFKNSYISLQKLNMNRMHIAKAAVQENESLKETIAKLESKLELLQDQPTSPKSQARVTNVSYVVQQSPNAIKNLEKQVDRLESELKDSKKQVDCLKSGHDRDQLIRFFQAMQTEYDTKGVPFNKRPQFYHDVRKSRNHVAHPSTE
ncbi:hypothetical protein AaE_015016 [Aphanomyces astaci]|uniref:Uncharacterized protein n=1 Tax=Aphanomyces astaci TaxID=112090 RepID=A0A6A4Z3T0_APHAT|nr:hypothetical protein AaE_015016 [Aphanomyces astaci]